MKQFRFMGYGDDTFGEYEQTHSGYDNSGSGEPIQYELKVPGGAGIIVTGPYCHPVNIGDGWIIGANVISEEDTVDDWTIIMFPSYEGYRNLLIVDAPDDAVLRCLNQDIEE